MISGLSCGSMASRAGVTNTSPGALLSAYGSNVGSIRETSGLEALSLCGRRVDALRQFDRLYTVLAEVGLEPSAALVELEDRIVRGTPR